MTSRNARAAATLLTAPAAGVNEEIAVVSAARDDGTANLTLRGGTLFGVPCLASYTPVKAGDVVVVRKTVAGWYVVGKTGSSTPTVVSVPPPTPALAPADVNPTSAGTWRGGAQREDVAYAVQGDWGGWGTNEGCWFYDTALHAAMTAGTVVSAAVTLTRQSVDHGDWGSVAVHLYTHASTAPPTGTPPGLAGPWIVGSLQLGEKDTFDLPDAAIASLQGTGRGLLVYSGVDDYILFAPASASCGAVHIVYQ